MDNSKHIAILGPAYPLRSGGLATFNERLARALIEEGHDVHIYTFSLQYPSILFPGSTQYSNEKPPNDLSISVVLNSINPLNWIKVGKKIAKQNPDIVIVRYWIPFLAPALGTVLHYVQKNKHTKIICIADNIIPHEKRPGDLILTKYFLKNVDGIITMSEKVLNDLRQLSFKKPMLKAIHPLYDNFGEPLKKSDARIKLDLAVDDKIILFFGFIREYKGLDLLIRAMADERIQKKQIKLLIAGEFYQDHKPYLQLIKDHSLGNRIILHTHFISDHDVKYYCSAADLIVQPYKTATQSGVTPLSYHFEKPMLVTNVGALPEIVPDGVVGFVCEPNPKSIADNILRFYDYDENTLIENIKQEKKKYSWKYFTDLLFELNSSIENTKK